MEPLADIALIGLAVMGQNLILNMNDHGFTVVAYNRSTEKVDQFLANEAKGTKIQGAHSIASRPARLSDWLHPYRSQRSNRWHGRRGQTRLPLRSIP